MLCKYNQQGALLALAMCADDDDNKFNRGVDGPPSYP
jgi:hypothetical protein